MMSSSTFEDSTSSTVAAERADMTEALLRGELSREDYETYIVMITNKE
ncbi:MAG: hypothetical protein IJ588_11180 [Prevotella sp.]|nr:hypothetical protein [Prevotella sp.]